MSGSTVAALSAEFAVEKVRRAVMLSMSVTGGRYVDREGNPSKLWTHDDYDEAMAALGALSSAAAELAEARAACHGLLEQLYQARADRYLACNRVVELETAIREARVDLVTLTYEGWDSSRHALGEAAVDRIDTALRSQDGSR